MTTKEVFEKLNQDNELALKVKAMKTPEEVYEACKVIGLTDSMEEFKKAAAAINDTISTLSEEDLAAVAGGKCKQSITTLTTTTTASIAAAAVI